MKKLKVALLNIGSEEIKGNEVLKNTYQKCQKSKIQILNLKVLLKVMN